MNKYHIKRIDPNTGQVWETGIYGEDLQTTETMPYGDCKAFLMMNQVELRVYKVGRIGSRKNAKRRMYKRICAENILEAMEAFNKLVQDEAVTLQLCTGDWRLIAEKKPTESTKLYFK